MIVLRFKSMYSVILIYNQKALRFEKLLIYMKDIILWWMCETYLSRYDNFLIDRYGSWNLFRGNFIKSIPRRESTKAGPDGVHFSILCVIHLVSRRVLKILIFALETKISKCFIPRREFQKQVPKGCIWVSFYFIQLVLRRVLENVDFRQ